MGQKKLSRTPHFVKASGRSRAGKNGKVIHCSCGASGKVYHFAWRAKTCQGCGELVRREDFTHLVG